MNKKSWIFLLVFSILILSLWWVAHDKVEKKSIEFGKIAPNFSLMKKDNTEISLHSLSGKYVLINFWATSCPPCVSEMDSLNQLSLKFKDNNLVVLGISLDSSWQTIDLFLEKHPVQFPIVLDSQFKVADAYQTFKIPETFLINPKGEIIQKYSGARDWMSLEVLDEIKKLIQ